MSLDSETRLRKKKTRLKQGGVVELTIGRRGAKGPAFTTHRIRILELGIRFRRPGLRKEVLLRSQLRIPELVVRFRRHGLGTEE